MTETKMCLASEVVLDFFIGGEATVQKVKLYSNEDLCISVLTFFELRSIIEKQEIVSEFLNFITILDFDVKAAETAANILRSDLHNGISRSTKDTINAAICISNNCLLFTKNRRDFEGIKALKFV